MRTAIIYEYSETGVVGLNRGRRIRLGRGESVDKSVSAKENKIGNVSMRTAISSEIENY